jgi:hypothetical protein
MHQVQHEDAASKDMAAFAAEFLRILSRSVRSELTAGHERKIG